MSINMFQDINLVNTVLLNTIRQNLSVYLNDLLVFIYKDYNNRI